MSGFLAGPCHRRSGRFRFTCGALGKVSVAAAGTRNTVCNFISCIVLAPAVWRREHKSGAQTMRPELVKLTNVMTGCCDKRSGVSSLKTCHSRRRALGCNGNGMIALPMPWEDDGGAIRCSRSGPRCDEGGCCLRNVPAHYCNVILKSFGFYLLRYLQHN